MTLDIYAGLIEDDLNDVADRMPRPPEVAGVFDLHARRG